LVIEVFVFSYELFVKIHSALNHLDSISTRLASIESEVERLKSIDDNLEQISQGVHKYMTKHFF
jgi:hypothetical protein